MTSSAGGTEQVELTIRCAFQAAPDQNFTVYGSWTVKRLKEYLHDVYPTHPAVASQRLIYGGGCLTDEKVLKDIFEHTKRVSESGEADSPKVLHLVCPLPQASPQLRRRIPASQVNAAGDANRTTLPESGPPPYEAMMNFYADRGQALSSEQAQTYANYYQNYYNYMYNYHTQMAAAMHAMQATSSAMNLPHPVFVQNNFGPLTPYIPANGTQAPVNLTGGNNEAVQFNPNQVDAPAAEGMAAQQNVHQPAEVVGNRFGADDILDLLYKGIRVMFLLTAVFVYSSLERFLLVVAIVLIIYLTQFRREQARRAAINADPTNARPNINNNNAGEQNRPTGVDENTEEATDQQNQAEEVPPLQQSGLQVFFATVYSFVTSFLASLVPDNIPVEVN